MSVRLVTPDEIMHLVDDLRDEGYSLSTRHYIALHDVLLALFARGDDVDIASLESVFGPVVCSTPDEQSRFRFLFRKWVERVRRRIELEAPKPVAPHDHSQWRSRNDDDSLESDLSTVAEKTGKYGRVLILGAVGLAILVGLLYLLA